MLQARRADSRSAQRTTLRSLLSQTSAEMAAISMRTQTMLLWDRLWVENAASNHSFASFFKPRSAVSALHRQTTATSRLPIFFVINDPTDLCTQGVVHRACSTNAAEASATTTQCAQRAWVHEHPRCGYCPHNHPFANDQSEGT